MENRHKHLEFIQGVINRLSSNSFLLKGWSVVLIAALFALAAGQSNSAFVFLAYLPAIVFWGLDGFFLRQEKLYRALYDYVRTKRERDIDFSMDTTVVDDKVESWLATTFSKTLVPFHGVIIVAIIVVMVVAKLMEANANGP